MLYSILKPIVYTIVRVLWRPRVTGIENLPSHGPAILASNHVSWTETVFMPAHLPRKVHFLAKSDLMTGKKLHQRFIGAVLRGLHLVPVDRSGGPASHSAVEAGIKVLAAGEVLGVYPEGTRSPDGRLYRGKTGMARMALQAEAPIVPVAVHGALEAMRGRDLIPRRRPQIVIELGEPILPDDFPVASRGGDRDGDGDRARALTDVVMERLQRMTGCDYVPEYASVIKQRMRAERDSH